MVVVVVVVMYLICMVMGSSVGDSSTVAFCSLPVDLCHAAVVVHNVDFQILSPVKFVNVHFGDFCF